MIMKQTNRPPLIRSLVVSWFLILHASPAPAQPNDNPRPNVLFIAVDDLRPELGCYGATPVKTPHIDQLAAQGTRFERAYCQVPVCGASRASLMTGIWPTATRFRNFATFAEKDSPNSTTLPQAFREAGYFTLSNGKIFHHPEDTEARSWSEPVWWPKDPKAPTLGLDEETNRRLSRSQRGRIFEALAVPDSAYPDGKTALKTIEDLRRLKQAGQPFFLGCGFVKPHMPFYAPKKYWDLYERDQIQLAANRGRPSKAPVQLRGSTEFHQYHLADFDENSEEFHRMMRHGYYACTSYVDKLIGDVLAELERLDLAKNTIVVLWGDHGWHLGEHNFWGKHNTMHLSLRVPLIIKVPDRKPASTRALVESSDIFPTLCALAGIKVPETVQGRSFTRIFDQPEIVFRESAYSRFDLSDAVVTENFSYTRYTDGGAEMLYDLRSDPQENSNVSGHSSYSETIEQMRTLLKQRHDESSLFGSENSTGETAPTKR